MRYLCVILLSVFAGVLTGCVTEVVPLRDQALSETTLTVTRAGNTTQLQWETDPGFLYTVMYARSRSANASWRALPQAVRIRGTGKTVSIKTETPAHLKRHYRLHIEPLQ